MVNMILDICQTVVVLLGFSRHDMIFESLSLKSVSEAVVRFLSVFLAQ